MANIMKAMKCEMCDSNDIVKEGDLYVCQNCGTKYEPEAAKKLLVEVDDTSKLANLRTLARRAREENNDENGLKYYEKILELDPNDWEAYFYSAYYKAAGTTIARIAYSMNNLASALDTTFSLAPKEADAELLSASLEVSSLAMKAYGAVLKSYKEFLDIGFDALRNHASEIQANMTSCANLLLTSANNIEKRFDLVSDANAKQAAITQWKRALLFFDSSNKLLSIDSGLSSLDTSGIVEKINEYEPGFSQARAAQVASQTSSFGGCYIATCVYGTYDCPQVWTLRRFRDYSLAETRRGRAFIKAYYAVSPILVKWFGDTDWFKRMWRGSLNRLVAKCKAKGFADTPYEDRNW